MSIREELELDISRALSNIDDLGRALTETAADFRADLARALAQLESEQVRITADTAGLAGDVTSAVDAADTAVVVTGDATELTGDITGAVDAADTNVVITGDGSELTGDITGAVDAADTNVVITGDASELTGKINAAVDAADTRVNIDGSGATDALSGIGAAGAGVTAGLGRSFAAVGGIAAGALAGIGLTQVVQGVQQLTDANSDLAESQSKVNVVFGAGAGEVQSFSREAATAIGQSQQQALEATGTFGNLFTALGLTQEAATQLSPEVVTLASDLASFNNIEVDDAITKLRSGLIGEIEPLRSLGVSFNAAQVEAKALELGLAATTEELTEGDKVLARYNLILEQSTNAQGDFARTSDGLANQIRITQAQFQDFLATAGAPLTVPFLEVIQAGLPVIQDLATAGAEVVAALLPIASAALEASQPLVALFSDTIINAARDFQPVIEAISDVLADTLPQAVRIVQPFLDAFGDTLREQAPQLAENIRNLQPLIDLFIDLAAAAGQLVGPILGVSSALNLLGSGGALGFLGQAFGLLGLGADQASEAQGAMEDLAISTFGLGTSLEETITQLNSFRGQFDQFIQTQSTFSEDAGLVRTLREIGISADDLFVQIGSLDAGFKDFAATAVDAGKVTIEVDGVEQTADQVRGLDGSLTNLINTGDAVITQGDDLLFAFNQQQVASEELARAQFDAVAAGEGWNEQKRNEVLALGEAEFGVRSYTNGLLALQTVQQQQAAEYAAGVLLPLEQQAGAWLSLADAVLQGRVTTENFGDVLPGLAERLGVSQEQIGQFVTVISEEVTRVAEAITSNIPNATAAFQGLTDSTNPEQLNTNLALQALAVANFTQNLRILLETGNADLVALLAQQGPQIGGAYAQAIVDGRDDLRTELEGNVDAFQTNATELDRFLREEAAPQIVNQGIVPLAQQTTNALGLNLDFAGAAGQPINDFSSYLIQQDQTSTAAGFAGEETGLTFGSGVATGIQNSTPVAENAAIALVRRVEEAARREAESESPSKLFAALGEDLTAGLEIGLQDGATDVVAVAEQIVRDAAATIAAESFQLPLQVQAQAQIDVPEQLPTATIPVETEDPTIAPLAPLPATVEVQPPAVDPVVVDVITPALDPLQTSLVLSTPEVPTVDPVQASLVLVPEVPPVQVLQARVQVSAPEIDSVPVTLQPVVPAIDPLQASLILSAQVPTVDPLQVDLQPVVPTLEPLPATVDVQAPVIDPLQAPLVLVPEVPDVEALLVPLQTNLTVSATESAVAPITINGLTVEIAGGSDVPDSELRRQGAVAADAIMDRLQVRAIARSA